MSWIRIIKAWWRFHRCPYHDMRVVTTYRTTKWRKGWKYLPFADAPIHIYHRRRTSKYVCRRCGHACIMTVYDEKFHENQSR